MDEQHENLADGNLWETDATPLCPSCLNPCSPLDYYCPNCTSNETVNPLASYMPFVKIRFEAGMFGKLWRKCWGPRTPLGLRIFYLFFFLIFSPIFLFLGLCILGLWGLRSLYDSRPAEDQKDSRPPEDSK